MPTKPLTPAQQRRLQQLNDATLVAQQQLNNFVAYLRDEHDAPADAWNLQAIDVGFEPVTPPEEGDGPEL